MPLPHRTSVALALAVPLLAAVVAEIPAQAQPRIPRSALTASVVPGLDRVVRTGPEQDSRPLSLAVSLKLRNTAELDRLLADQAAGRAKYLTPEQFRDRFAPTSAEVDRVTGYLRAQGLTVTGVSANRLAVDVTGTVGQLRGAFGTEVSRWHDSLQGRDFTAAESAPTLPSDLAPLVSDVAGLDEHHAVRHHAVGGGPAGGYTPAELRSAYNLNQLGDGSGQTLAVFAYGKFDQANIDVYTQHYGLPATPPTVKPIDGGNSTGDAAQGELELDIEVVQAIAPKAALVVYAAPNTSAGEIDMWNAVVADRVPVVSTSWGLCEYDRSPGSMTAVDNVAKQAAAQGMSVFAAAGDAGAYDCERDSNTTHAADLSVDFPGSDPYVTSVGGTTLALNSDGTRSSETTWNQGGGWAGGGGESNTFDRPAWQPGTGKRQVPDVSAAAAGGHYSIYSQGKWITTGGTSASAPLWAAYLTLHNQRAAAEGKQAAGAINPKLYALAGAGFNDITVGTNRYYSAAVGYDLATGWGTPDGQSLSTALLR